MSAQEVQRARDGQEDLPRAWHEIPAESVLIFLKSRVNGLTATEASTRLLRDGPNEVRETRPPGAAVVLLRQFTNILVWILIAGIVLSLFLGQITDAVVIGAVVTLNSLIGFTQEYRAGKSIEALRHLTAARTTVIRDGSPQQIEASKVVTGDIVRINSGDLICADARILTAESLQCLEAALTGESRPVTKSPEPIESQDCPVGDRKNMVFRGTEAAVGCATAVVVATGMDTELGKIAGLTETAASGRRFPLQERLAALGRILVAVSLGVVLLLFLLGLSRGVPIQEMAMTSVGLAVAAVPEGLPAIVTIALAIGVLRMARLHCLVRTLPAVETLGSANVICTDKTGTLTIGDMTVQEMRVAEMDFTLTGGGHDPQREILYKGAPTVGKPRELLLQLAESFLASNNARLVSDQEGWKIHGDPTEGALLVAGIKAGGNVEALEKRMPRHSETPFNSERKRRTVIRRLEDGNYRMFVTGAPDVIIPRCTHFLSRSGVVAFDDGSRKKVMLDCERRAAESVRVLGTAFRDLPEKCSHELNWESEENLVFVGTAGMTDPPRPTAKESVALCLKAGIHIVMITGDHPETALSVAREVGIAGPTDLVVTGAEIDRTPEKSLCRLVHETRVFARVNAGHKLRIVKEWQARDSVVAMTGDGVNDAPSLRGADIGIAMGKRGTEAAKQASDIVIADDDFSSIVAAVEQGRGIYENIRKTLQYLLAGNTAEIALMTACIVTGLPTPLLPVHLLWINLVTDGLPALCLATDRTDPEVMSRPPRPRGERITSGSFLPRILIAGGTTAAACTTVFTLTLHREGLETARSLTFATLVFSELVKSFAFRSTTLPVWKHSPFSNPALAAVVAGSLVLQVGIHHAEFARTLLTTTSQSFHHWLAVITAGTAPLAALEIHKFLTKNHTDHHRNPPVPSHGSP